VKKFSQITLIASAFVAQVALGQAPAAPQQPAPAPAPAPAAPGEQQKPEQKPEQKPGEQKPAEQKADPATAEEQDPAPIQAGEEQQEGKTAQAVSKPVIEIGLGSKIFLPSCGGTLEISQPGLSYLTMDFRNVKLCSNFDILGEDDDGQGYEVADYKEKKIPEATGPQDRSGNYTMPKDFFEIGLHKVKVIVKSNSGSTSDTMLLSYRVVRTGRELLLNGQDMNNAECRGQIRFKVQNGQANVVVGDVTRCSRFTISGNGEQKSYDLQPQGGAKGGSYTVPKKFIRAGWNVLSIDVHSDYGARDDAYDIGFYAK
jgi:hypothetical protein